MRKNCVKTQDSMKYSASFSKDWNSLERKIPDRREFTQEKRRLVVLRVLDRLGFKSEDTGRHEKFRHIATRGTVAVPLSLEAAGTRQGVYEQVIAALAPKEDNKDD
jgi:hypothetical protein